jgi:hypothetical protein
MLTIAIVLIIMGGILIALPAFGGNVSAPLATLGWLLAVVGIVLLVVVLVFVSSDEVDAHLIVGGGFVAMAVSPRGTTFHGAGDKEPAVPVAGATAREPVIVAFLIGAVPVVCAFILQVLEATDVLDSALWLRTLLVGLGSLATALGALWARSNVTPTAAPKLDADTPLVPVTEREGV